MAKLFTIFIGLLMGLSLNSLAQSEEVGTLNGQLTVAPNGAAIYNIQLDLPQGRGGLTPQLALQYNSLAGDGVLGKGWGINGWSYVGREAETPYYEGMEDYQREISRVDFDSDGFSIDGNRLLLVQQSTDKDTYRFEMDYNTRVFYHNPFRASDRINKERDNSYFEVQSPDGSKKIYGSSGSKQIYGTGNPAIRYYLKQVVDLSDNTIEYNYDTYQSTGEIYLKEIIYSKDNEKTSLSSTEYYKVEFKYSGIPMQAHHYTTFIPYNNNKYEYTVSQVLESVSLRFFEAGSSSTVKQWKLEYQQGGLFGEINSSNGKSFLKQIILTDGDGKGLEPTVFEWTYNISSDKQERKLAYETFTNTHFLDTQSISGDFNGDGLTDIAEGFTFPSYGLCLRLSNYSGLSNRQIIDSDFQGKMLAMDVNGDGADELIVFSADNEEIRLYTWNGSSMRQVGNEINEKIIHKGDFTGDGMADLVTKSGNDFFIYPGKTDITEFFDAANKNPLVVFTNFENALAGNFLGNAKTGFMLKDGASLKLYTLKVTQTTSGKSYTFDNKIGSDTPIAVDFNIASMDVGDFNGDGKDDLIMTEVFNIDGDRNTRIYYSYGNGFERSVNLGFWNQIQWYSQPGQYLIADYNNDGVSDILFWRHSTPNNDEEYVINHYFMFKSQGIESDYGFKMRNVTTRTKFIQPEPNSTSFGDYHIGDFNGNGETDIFFQFFSEYGTPVNTIDSMNIRPPDSYIINQYHNLADNSSPDDLITGITNGLGEYQKISYKTYNAGNYESVDYPVVIHKKPFTLVSKIETRRPQGGFFPATEYEFTGLMLHTQGKGLLGFQRTQVTDQMRATRSESMKKLLVESNSYYFPYDAFQFTKHLQTNNILSQTRTSYEVFRNPAIDNPLVFKPIMTKSVTNQWDNDANHTYIGMNALWQEMGKADIDDFGNSKRSYQIADEWASYPSLEYKEMHYITTKMAEYNYPTANQWLITPKYHKTIYYSRETPDEVIEKTAYTYYASGLPETSTFYPRGNLNSKLALETTYNKYDAYGNLEQKTVSAINQPDLPDRVSKFKYDKTGRFLEQKIIGMTAGDDWIVNYKYDHKQGLLTGETMIDGNTTTYEYNSFGTPTVTIHPDGTTDHIKMEWCKPGPGVPENAKYVTKEYTRPVGSEDKWYEKSVYYDLLGRKLRKVVKNFQDKTIFNDYEYNLKGQLEFVYEPYYVADGRALFTRYHYDELGRISKTILPDESIDSIIYLGRKTLASRTKGDISIATETVVNIMGDTDMKKDAVININYDYDGKRRLRKTHRDFSTTEIIYDEAGNQEALIDPDAGTTTYSYNAFGELISQTDANGNHTEMTYKDGRLDSKTLSNQQETITYEYDYYQSSIENGFGKLKEENCNNGTSIAYTYDQLGRISKKTETINQNIFIFEYTYNPSSGMLETYTYPSGVKLKYVYNQRGDMSKILGFTNSNWTEMWNGTQQNQRGQWTHYNTAGLFSSNYYDAYGYPMRTLAKHIHAMLPLQDYRYSFEPATGNLSWRTDAIRGLTESFTYDEQLHSRLTGWSVNGQNVAELQYQANGNISRKTDVSNKIDSYIYNRWSKPHAVKKIEEPTTEFLTVSYEQDVTYNLFNKISSVTHPYEVPPLLKKHRLRFTYGPDNLRRKMDYYYIDRDGKEMLARSKYYLDSYELEVAGGTTSVHYLNGPTGLFGILVQKDGSEQLYFVLKDHLGSITGITDASGNILEALSYDPWGRRRNANNWTDYNVGYTMFDRGYTGHEHLDQFSLINMNGRIYDPFLARFLSPDPHVQAPDNTQNFNRYSYALNNPLKYTDPSGEFVHLVVGAIIGGYINVFMNKDKMDNPWQMFGYLGIGALGGALGAGVGSGVSAAIAGNAAAGGGFMAGFMGTATLTSTGFIAGGISGAAAGFANGLVSGTGNQLIEGERFGDALVNGGLSQAWRQAIGGAVIGGAIGGIDALTKGSNFWTGKASFDLSNTYGANGTAIGNKTVTGRYVGKFEGVKLYEAPIPDGSAATLPGRGIILSKGQYTLNSASRYTRELLQHEFGHILQAREVGLRAFYNVIAPESLASATMDGVGSWSHSAFWTETWANYLSNNHFGVSSLLNNSAWPAQNISLFNSLRLRAVSPFFWP